ncbi:hypothetical protein ACKWTF_015562 [Chironomus riparius]
MSRKIVCIVFCALLIKNVQNIEDFSCKLSKIDSKLHKTNSYKCELQQQHNQPEIHAKNIPQISNDQITAISATSDATSTHFTSKICETFPNVLEIDFRNTKIETFEEASFRKCKNLAVLMLSDNKIKEIPEILLNENQNLEMLLMENILIDSVPRNFLKSQRKSLRTFHITSKSSYKVPEDFFSLFQNLEDLSIGNVVNFNFEWTKNLKSLKTLSITSCKIHKIPDNSFNDLKKLENLSLAENMLKIICADSFGILPNLKHIDFSFNEITAIDEVLIDNTGVVTMDMRGNGCANDKSEGSAANSKETLKEMLKKCTENYNGCQ